MSIYLGNTKIFNPQVINKRDIEKENLFLNKEVVTCTNNKVNKIRDYAFYNCFSLQTVDLPNVSYIGNSAFANCTSLQSVNLPMVSYIGSYAFSRCYNLLSLYLTNSVRCTLSHSNAFNSTPIAGYTTSTGGVYGSIYVPASLLTSYKTATNWTVYSSRFVSI